MWCVQVYYIQHQKSAIQMLTQYLEVNDLSGRVQVIDKRPEAVTKDDVGGQQVR